MPTHTDCHLQTPSLRVPLRFLPYLRPMVWGGRRLATELGKTLPEAKPYGESWDVSDHRSHASVVASGPHAGRTLRQLMQEDREALLGRAAKQYTTFPWLVKFLDAADWLSVQVHPDDELVQALWPGEGGKTEAWYVLDAAPSSRIYAGLLPGVGAKELRAALAAGTVAECLHTFTPRAGDCVFLPAGTVHAVGGGVLMAEVQQTSDATFRLYDWDRIDKEGRRRELHIEQAMKCIDWKRGPVRPVRGEEQPALVRNRYFEWDYVQTDRPIAFGGANRLQLILVLDGKGRFATVEEEVFAPGQAWVLPAALPRGECRPEGTMTLLVCTLPAKPQAA